MAQPSPTVDNKAKKRAEKIAKRGFAAYDDEDYLAAISFFEEAYEIAPVAGLLFNIAHAHRLMGRAGCAPALDNYRRYLAADGDSDRAELARTRITEMKKCVAKRRKAREAAEPVTLLVSSPPPPKRSQATGREAGNDALPANAIVSDASPRSGRRRAGWIVGGVGILALGGAATTAVLARQRESDLSRVCSDNQCPASLRGVVTDYNRLRITTIAAGALGVGALATSAWLLLTSGDDVADGRSASASNSRPWISASSMGVQWNF